MPVPNGLESLIPQCTCFIRFFSILSFQYLCHDTIIFSLDLISIPYILALTVRPLYEKRQRDTIELEKSAAHIYYCPYVYKISISYGVNFFIYNFKYLNDTNMSHGTWLQSNINMVNLCPLKTRPLERLDTIPEIYYIFYPKSLAYRPLLT
ncbi:hypothetical protein PITCH_A780105 [uncultured Desulfobacterium sp.]|uniref:Uncharacterized protein n=1 Tax=uncultured Desulfobacterium sp. TaxID=201089 RepID=A0A445N2P3_9BACT|nr:hypothetical protein PITCH_A780105 [uncultured Desulfobacterium sp.]